MSIKILTTGGTIDKVYFDANSEYHIGPPEVESILQNLKVGVDYEVEMLLRKDSLELTDEDRETVRTAADTTHQSRILITHGTDTMVQTGKHLRSIADKTIVLVGSLSPSRFKGTDAEFNIGFALAATQTLGPGVYVAMSGQIFDIDNVQKNREKNCFERID